MSFRQPGSYLGFDLTILHNILSSSAASKGNRPLSIVKNKTPKAHQSTAKSYGWACVIYGEEGRDSQRQAYAT